MEERELFESFWLCTVKGIGQKSMEMLLNKAGTITNISNLSREDIIACIGRKKAQLLEAASVEKEKKRAENQLIRIWEKGILFLPYWHPDYPARLRAVSDPPLMLFVKGKLPDQRQKQAALIGARACSAYGVQMARYFSAQLAQAGVGIISGMARGIDSIAQEAALDVGQSSVAVLGCGVDVCYPPENRRLYERLEQDGCLISEYLPGTQPLPHLFPPRNRIISGMSDLVLVIEAREKSGTLITVDMALEQGREVYAVPGRIQDACSRGCNRLIENGAGIATKASVVLEALGCREETAKAQTVTGKRPLSACVLAALDTDFLSLDEIAERITAQMENTQISMPELMQELLLLNIEEKVLSVGGRYCQKQ